MPIKPLKKALYPPNFRNAAFELKEAAGWRCQRCGRQCRRQFRSSDGHISTEPLTDFLRRMEWHPSVASKPRRYTLTVAHLDQIPTNNDPSNLMALCSVCHLQHDRPYQRANRLLYQELVGQLNLFYPIVLPEWVEAQTPSLSGLQLTLFGPQTYWTIIQN